MAEETPAAAPMPKTPDGFYDLTGLDAPRFKFQFTIHRQDGKTETVQRDMDSEWIGMQLASSLPTLFAPVGMPGSDGKPRYGFHVVVESFQAGVALPSNLPPLTSVIATIKRIFNLGDEIGVRGTMLLFAAFAQDMNARMHQKKGTPDSPGSPVPSPAV